ncbi:invasin domain 3-containing protein, partial [Orbus sasakiae]|uniref:invasin domain 3-containing protein n=1 Tax=Orbus sasakiae TaxID=1078475 RepID=UPI0031E5927F
LGTVTYIGETDGVYSFSVKSATRGSDEFVFKTSSTTSTKSATVTYAAGSVFDQTKSTIVAEPTTIDADGVTTSTVSVTMYYASDSSKLLTGYTGLELARKDGGAIVGTVTYIGETDGVYSFSVKSATRGSDEFVFKTSTSTSTKSATVTYAAGSVFDQTKSTIVAEPTTIDADGVTTSTVSVTMYYASDSSKLLTGYTGLELARKDGTAILGTVTYIGETDGVYSFSVKSATRGSDEFVFKTSSTTSTKSATVTYAAGSVFDQTKSTIVANPGSIDADGVATSTVSVTMYYASDSSKLLTGYTGLELARKDGTAILGTVTYIGETDGVYSFSVKSATRGSDEFVFKTSSTTSTKSATVTYTIGAEFDQSKSTIVADPATIDSDGVAASTVSVTMYYASDSSKLLTGYTG